MSNFIRFYCVSLFLLGAAFGNEGVQLPWNQSVEFETSLSMQSQTTCSGHSIPLESTQRVKGSFTPAKASKTGRVSLELVLKDALWTIKDQENQVSYSLTHPGNSLEMNELAAFRHQPFQAHLNKQPPFIELTQDFIKRYQGLHIFQCPILDNFLGEDLNTLFSICEHPIQLGEEFDLLLEKNHQTPYKTIKRFSIKELTPETVMVEVLTKIERQRINFDPSGQAVIHGRSMALWEINRDNGFLYQMQEEGVLTQAMRINGVETTQDINFQRHSHSNPNDLNSDGEGQSENNSKGSVT